jgi:hypothetical protein
LPEEERLPRRLRMGRTDDLLVYLIALIVLTVIVAVLLIWVVVSALKKKRDPQSSPIEVVAEPKPSPSPVAAPVVLEKAEPLADREVLRVLRDMSSGTLYLEVEGRAYRNVTEIHSPEVSRLVQQVAADMIRFARNVTPAVPAAGAAPLTSHLAPTMGPVSPVAKAPSLIQAHDSTPPMGTPTPGSLARRGEALINPAPPPPPPAAPGLLSRTSRLATAGNDPAKKPNTGPLSATAKKPKTGPLSSPATQAEERVDLSAIKDNKAKVDVGSFWGRALSSPNTAGVAGPRPLADELEDVLQALLHSLAKAPPFEVHFKTAGDGSLLIDIDGVSYQGVDAIRDPAAKQLVQIVIKKWEAV